jgi:hypothetical protein
MIDYSILAALLICVGTLIALWIVLYKPAEDAAPPFPVKARYGGNVIPSRPSRGLLVEFSDGREAMLPFGNAQPSRFEQLLEVA